MEQLAGFSQAAKATPPLRAEMAVTLKWIAAELHMGTWTLAADRTATQAGRDTLEPDG
jgi:hypothetical protein